MQIKKQFEELYAILDENKNRKVSTILPQLIELMSRKSAGGANGKTFIKNDDGEVVAIFCYYHKKWELLSEVEFGKKTNTASGYNTMCKEGVSAWTKANRAKKKAEDDVLAKVMAKQLAPEDVADYLEDLVAESKVIVPRADGLGFDTLEEVMQHI